MRLATTRRASRAWWRAVRRGKLGGGGAPAGALWVGVPAAAPAAAATDRIAQRVPAVEGRPLHVRVTVGEVRVRAEDRTDIAVVVEREVPAGQAPAALPVRIEPEGDALRVSALQPGQSRDPSLVARVDVAVPASTAVLVEVGEGACEVVGVRSALQVTVDRGPATLRRVSGVMRVETRSGDILVEGADLPPTGLLRVRALTGNVSIELATRPADARLLLLALSGRVEATVPLEDRGGPGRRIREAVLGSGKALLSVDVVRGDIIVRMP